MVWSPEISVLRKFCFKNMQKIPFEAALPGIRSKIPAVVLGGT
jgi:hypothetical protein